MLDDGRMIVSSLVRKVRPHSNGSPRAGSSPGVAGLVAAQVMFYVGNGNNFNFWFFATVVGIVIAVVLAVANAVGGLFSGLILRRVRRGASRVARAMLAGTATAVLGAAPLLYACLLLPKLHAWWPLPVASSCASAVCVAVVVAFVKVKPPQARPTSNRRVPGIRL